MPSLPSNEKVVEHEFDTPILLHHLHESARTRAESTHSVDSAVIQNTGDVTPDEVDILITDWDGPDDPLNPGNWSTMKKWGPMFIIGIMCTINNIGASIISIGLPQIIHDFHTTRIGATMGVSLYVLGLGIGPLIAAPISEEYGRKPVYITAYSLFILFQIPCAFGSVGVGLPAWLIFRFLSGCAASPGPTVGSGTVSDLFPPKTRALPTTAFVVFAFVGPAMGPVLSGPISQATTWRWTIWATMIMAGCLYPFIWLMPETYKPVIISKSVARRRKNGEKVIGPALEKLSVKLKKALIRPPRLLVTEPIIFMFGLYCAFVYALLFGYTSVMPFVFQSTYGFELRYSGLPFLAVVLGVILALPVYWYLFEPHYIKLAAPRPPEARLPPMIAGAVALPTSLFLFGWTAGLGVHWIVPVLSNVIYGFSTVMLFLPAISYSVDAFQLVAASAAGANSLIRYVAAFIFPLFSRAMFVNMKVKWAVTLLGCMSLLLMPIPFVFMRYGERVRKKGPYYRDFVKPGEDLEKEAELREVAEGNSTPNQKVEV